MEEGRDENVAGGPVDTQGDTVSRMREEAKKTLHEINGNRGIMALFNFDKLYFPFFAKVLFIIYCVFTLVFGVILAVAAIAAMVTQGVFNGIVGLLIAFAAVVAGVIGARIWIELVMVAFNINDAVQDIRKMLREKSQ